MPSNLLINNTIAPFVSVIVPCYNSERTIRRCLTSIFNQQTSLSFDITVVDSSSDQTPRIVEDEFPSVQLIHLETRVLAGDARNLGVRSTRAPFCLMIDSDCVAHPNVIELALQRHREDSFAAVGGALENGTPRSLIGLIGYLAEFKEFMPTAPFRLSSSVPTACVAYRRDTFEQYGGFHENLWPAEDILLHWKMHCARERILFDPAIKVTHLNRTGWHEVLSYQIELGRTSALARRLGGLPGTVLLRHLSLIVLMPFVRTIRAAIWLARCDFKMSLLFLLIWPLYFLAMSFWSVGFFRGARQEKLV
jgi:glycosyltransferase involved in cell wall biosynthesis